MMVPIRKVKAPLLGTWQGKVGGGGALAPFLTFPWGPPAWGSGGRAAHEEGRKTMADWCTAREGTRPPS